MIYKFYLKRWLDVMFALILLIALIPLFLILAGLIKFTLGGNVFFIQARGGKNGAVFHLIKFKTMRDLRDAQGDLLPDQYRMTRLGKLLRTLSLDELPTLLNVVKGEMSFIGPRPLITEYLAYYNEFQQQRHLVTPGITGWAQVNGRNAISWEEKFTLDVWYVQQQSFCLDLKILCLTILRILKPQNINTVEDTTMPKFLGSTPNQVDAIGTGIIQGQ